MNYRWDSWGHKDWDNIQRLSWALILQHIFDDFKDNTNISESQLKEFIKNLSDNTSITDIQFKEFIKNINEDINIFEYISHFISKVVPEQQLKNWSESNKYNWSVSKDKEWSWTDIFKTLVGSESVNIIEHFTAILTKYINASDSTNLFDTITKNIDKNNLDATKIDELINFVIENLYNDTAAAVEFVKKDIHKYLPEYGFNLWGNYIKDLWRDLSHKTIKDVLESVTDTEYIEIFDFVISQINKNIGDNINLSEIRFFEFAKLLQESANINEFVAKFIEKNLDDNTKMFDEIKKDVHKNISDITNIEDETYYKLRYRPVRVEMDILDMNYNKVAILTNAWDVCVTEVVNGEYSLSFKMPINEPIAKLIDDKHYIQVKKQTFFFSSATSERTQSNQRFINVEAQHVFFELENKYWEEDDESKNYISGAEPYAVMKKILEKTTFATPYITGIKPTDILLKRGSVMNNLKIVVDAYGVELKRDNYSIGLEKRIGTDKGIQFRYSKNIKSIKKTVDMRNIIHRLYVYGKDGLTIDGVNDGKAYLDCEYIKIYEGLKSKIKISEITFNNITNLKDLKEKGEEYLKKYQVPQITYDVSIVELQKLSGMIYDQSFGIGDNVTIIDAELDADVKARVVEYRYYPFEPKESSVVLGNFIPRATDFFTKWNDTSGVIDNAFFKDTGKVNTKWLEGIIDVMQNKLLASGEYQTAEVFENQGFLLENLCDDSPSYGALYLGPGIFSISDHKDDKGLWDWRTFGTGAGFTADVINTGTLNAGLINVIGLEVGGNVTMGKDATISWEQVSNQPDIAGIATKITEDTVDTSYINALKVTAEAVSTDWVYAGEINADKITTGALNATLITTGTFNATNLEVIGLEVGGKITMGENATIDWDKVTGEKNSAITKITENAIQTSKIVAEFIDTRKINADNITTGKLNASEVKIVSSNSDDRLEMSSDGLIGYSKGKGVHGVFVDNRTLSYTLISYGNVVGRFYFDTNGAGNNSEAMERVMIETLGKVPLKFLSGSGISFQASDKIYFASPTKFDSQVDFTNATITGLDTVAKFG